MPVYTLMVYVLNSMTHGTSVFKREQKFLNEAQKL
jgi:hypothetical protein